MAVCSRQDEAYLEIYPIAKAELHGVAWVSQDHRQQSNLPVHSIRRDEGELRNYCSFRVTALQNYLGVRIAADPDRISYAQNAYPCSYTHAYGTLEASGGYVAPDVNSRSCSVPFAYVFPRCEASLHHNEAEHRMHFRFSSDLAPPQKSGKWLLRGSAVE